MRRWGMTFFTGKGAYGLRWCRHHGPHFYFGKRHACIVWGGFADFGLPKRRIFHRFSNVWYFQIWKLGITNSEG